MVLRTKKEEEGRRDRRKENIGWKRGRGGKEDRRQEEEERKGKQERRKVRGKQEASPI